MKYYLISSKSDDYGASNKMVIHTKESKIKRNVYHYVEIPKDHYEILKEYLGDFYDYFEEESLEEYFG